jgi:hypothetical protein
MESPVPEPTCNTQMLDVLRGRALVEAAAATDPLVRQQYIDLAETYAVTATDLREGRASLAIEHRATQMPWRSVPLWVTNDR